MIKNAVEIKLGNVVYQVEREFVGTVSREELLISRLIEDKRIRPARIETDSNIGEQKKDG